MGIRAGPLPKEATKKKKTDASRSPSRQLRKGKRPRTHPISTREENRILAGRWKETFHPGEVRGGGQGRGSRGGEGGGLWQAAGQTEPKKGNSLGMATGGSVDIRKRDNRGRRRQTKKAATSLVLREKLVTEFQGDLIKENVNSKNSS